MVLQYLLLQVTKFNYYNFLNPQSYPALTGAVFQFEISQYFNLFEHQSFKKTTHVFKIFVLLQSALIFTTGLLIIDYLSAKKNPLPKKEKFKFPRISQK